MEASQYKKVNIVIDGLLANIKLILNKKLVALYLEGSLVYGDFDENISDIDLLAVLTKNANSREFNDLQKMHDNVIIKHKEWKDRIEVCYASIDAINSTKFKDSEILNISPGEPFHKIKTKKEWLMNWYLTRNKSRTLFGPLPNSTINFISKEEFIQSIKEHARSWQKWVKNLRNPFAQSYAILTMCRALYSYRNYEQISKIKAAHWAKNELPEFTDTIQNALVWRKGDKYLPVDEKNYPKTVEFVNYVIKLILEK